MPHWQIYHTPDAFQDDAHKHALTKAITSHYTREGVAMPAFYVVVDFIQVPHSSHFVGGEQASSRGKPFIRIAIAHIHINLPKDETVYKSVTDDIDRLIKPYIEDKGYDWEYHIEETERLLWKINGLAPPEVRLSARCVMVWSCTNVIQWKSEDEKVWRHESRAVPPNEMDEARKRLARL